MDVQWTGVVSECSNPVLCWAKVSLLGIGVESVIIFFENNSYLVNSVNLAGKVYHVSWGSALTNFSVMTLVPFFSLLDACDH